MPPVIQGAVEGIVDEAVAQRLIREAGGVPGAIYGKRGKGELHRKVTGFNNAARFSPWFVLVDLDADADCAPPFSQEWLPEPSPLMRLRVAVREVESWLLADRERFSRFLGVRQASLPRDPESLDDPKRTVVQLASQSRRRDVREEMVPRDGSGRTEGPAYAFRLIEFVGGSWRPDVAAGGADSLARCRTRLAELVRVADTASEELAP